MVIQIPMAGDDIIVSAAAVGHIDKHYGLVVGSVLRKITWGFVPGNRQYPFDKVRMSIIAGIGAIGVAASMPNWLLCCVVRAATSLGNEARRQRRRRRRRRQQQNWRNKTARLVFLHDVTLRIDQSWRSPSSYGRHGAPLPAFKYTTISKHTMEQVYIVKTRKTIINNVY